MNQFMVLVAVVATIVQINADGLTVTVDTSQAPQLANFANTVKQALVQWYPFMVSELATPGCTTLNAITLVFDPTYNGAAYTSMPDGKIVASVNYYNGHQNDVGSLIHELTHVIQFCTMNFRTCPTWLIEGLADWMRYYRYEPDGPNVPSKPAAGTYYTNGYSTAAYFLQYIMNNSLQWFAPRHMVYWATYNCRQGNYSDAMWPAMTGKTLDQHWQDMMNQGNINTTSILPVAPTIRYFKNLGSLLCLDSNYNGDVYMLQCNDDLFQKWTIVNGNVIQNVQTGRCLDSNANGDVYTSSCNGGDSQKWRRNLKDLQSLQTWDCLDSNVNGKVYVSAYCNFGNYMMWI